MKQSINFNHPRIKNRTPEEQQYRDELAKTLQEQKNKNNISMCIKNISNDARKKDKYSNNSCEYWEVNNFTVSPNGKLVAYIIKRIMETYRPGRDEHWNGLCIKDIETQKEYEVIGLQKYLDTSGMGIADGDFIYEIQEISNDLKIICKMKNGKIIEKQIRI